ncbi:Plant disease resistance response protein [Macleaya cordata]|uniref:Dirigent protein n=1 Tax=Macleaya cordata TaxID=56857 RepID=A0A200RDB7_MACCD|nr:Plant disease resistance response protein [Macleaya cordata]
MAGIHSKSAFSIILLSIFIFYINIIVDGKPHSFGRVLNPAKMGFKKEKFSHFRVYWHDIPSGPNPTAIRVAAAPSTNKSATGFGAVVMIDDPLTEGLELSSKLVGRAQGFYALASQNDAGALMVMNFVFNVGKYNGSTISIFGRNLVLSKVREMPIVGGSGLFRFARGYVEVRTRKFDIKSGDATNEYNIYVFHY